MSELLVPVAQFMPGFDPLGSIIGCWIFLFVLATYITGVVAVGAGIRSLFKNQPRAAQVARGAGAFCFLGAFLLVLFYSRATFRSHLQVGYFFVIAGGAPAVLGLIGWLFGARRAARREIWLAPLLVIACVGIAVLMIRRDLDFRQRRDALLAAARRGDATEVRTLLAGLSAGLTDHNGNPLLVIAPNAATTEAVLAAGARIDADPRALAWAAQHGNLPKMKVLLAHGADPNRMMGDKSPARLAWWSKQEAALELLRQSGARDAEMFQRATGALMRAVNAGDAAAVKLRLAGEYVDEERQEGLKVAAERGDVAVMELLMASTTQHAELAAAALIAAQHDRVPTFKMLMAELHRRQAGYIVRQTTDAALSIAARTGNREIARLAIARTEDGSSTPLKRAARRGDLAVVSLLIDAGAPVDLASWSKEDLPTDPAVLKRLQAPPPPR